MTNNEKMMLEAIRRHRLIGRGSCTSVDECYSDEEVIRELRIYGIATEDGAISHFIKNEDIFMEQQLNTRWGEDDDPQLTAYETWMKIKSEKKEDYK